MGTKNAMDIIRENSGRKLMNEKKNGFALEVSFSIFEINVICSPLQLRIFSLGTIS